MPARLAAHKEANTVALALLQLFLEQLFGLAHVGSPAQMGQDDILVL